MISLLLLSINLACNKAATEPPLDTGEKTQANVDKTRSEAILTDVSQQQPETPINAILNLPEDQAGLVLAMEEKETAGAAVEKLVAMGPQVVPTLRDVALHGQDIGARGWAITGLQQLPGPEADKALLGIQEYGAAPELVRTWAAAARINRCGELDCVMALAPLSKQYPALGRPIRLKIESKGDQLGDLASALQAVASTPTLAEALTPIILASGTGPLAGEMFTHPENEPRRLAAGYLGTLGQASGAQMDIAKLYAYTPGAEQVPWQGGALYVPGLTWDKKEAKVLSGYLVSWHLYCDRMGLTQEKQQIYNNLQSINLHRPAGWPDWPSRDTNALLVQYGQAAGRPALEKVLSEHGVKDDTKYQGLLDQVGSR